MQRPMASSMTADSLDLHGTSEVAASLPFPFESESSLGQGNTSNVSMRRRILEALGFGFSKGQVEQKTRSCERGPILHIANVNMWYPVNEYPQGYGKVAAIEDLDPDLLVYRKFGWLHNYALLYLQDELTELQNDLESHDRWESRDGDPQLLISRRLNHDSRRKELIAALHSRLAQYGKLSQIY